MNPEKSFRSLHEHSAQALSRLNKLEERQMTLDSILKQNQQVILFTYLIYHSNIMHRCSTEWKKVFNPI